MLARRHLRPRFNRQRLELPDGDFLDLDWTGPEDSGRPLVLVLHGLEGSSQSHYVRGLCSVLSNAGFRSCVMHYRGCSGDINRLPRTYHAGETGDPDFVIGWLRHHYPGVALFAVGFSLGGNMLLKLLGEQAGSCVLSGAAAVSVPFDLASCAERLEKGTSRIYQHWLVSAMKKTARQKATQYPGRLDINRLLETTTFREFDELGTAPLHGFAGARDYYAKDSCRQYLPQITTRTLIVQSHDDPFIEAVQIPEEQELGPGVHLELTARGGHLGFVTGPLPGCTEYWLERRLTVFFTHLTGEFN